jgi:iron complex outermembrane receptor protein
MLLSRILVPALLLTSCFHLHAQESKDSISVLDEVVVQAYATDRPLREVPAAISLLNAKNLERFSNTSILPAINTIPGVRMEERSPGSYRFSIRGSLLRSPFGVRNVKMYWNGLPLTDAGGNTYVNLLDYGSVSGIEIIKGPGGSLYGAGTGGVVLLRSSLKKTDQVEVSTLFGSYGLQRYTGLIQTGSEAMNISVSYAMQRADGYREQSAMNRGVGHVDLNFKLDSKNTISATAFYSDLQYETPGGLTKAQYDADPRQARPSASAAAPGAVDQKAAVSNKTSYVGISHEVQWNSKWLTRTGIYGSSTDFNNPTIRNYEVRDEKNGGLRTETHYSIDKDAWQAKFTGGAEIQFFNSQLDVYGNDRGTKTKAQTKDKLESDQYLIFLQSDLALPHEFFLTLGASINYLNYRDLQSVPAQTNVSKKFDPDVSPRIALLKKFRSVSVYGTISRGFSPPGIAEALPSTGGFNRDLNAERGTSYDLGVRGKVFGEIDFDIAFYDFQLKNAIVIQRADDGADYFVNAGSTSQKGIEGMLSWDKSFSGQFFKNFRLWTSITINDYTFNNYNNNGQDNSGKMITGVTPGIVSGGFDLTTLYGLYTNVTVNNTDHIPLNDANSEYASTYTLLGARLGFRKTTGNFPFEIFTGIDNALDQTYSLGNDLNAIGGRYYNVAAGRNFYFGVKVRALQ